MSSECYVARDRESMQTRANSAIGVWSRAKILSPIRASVGHIASIFGQSWSRNPWNSQAPVNQHDEVVGATGFEPVTSTV